MSLLAGNLFARLPSPGADLPSARTQASWKQETLVALLAQLGFVAAVPSPADLEDAEAPLAQLAREGKLQLLAEHTGAELPNVSPSLLLRTGPYILGVLNAAGATAANADTMALATATHTRSDRLRAQGAQQVLLICQGLLSTAELLAREANVDVVVHTSSGVTEGQAHWVEVRAEDAGARGEAPAIPARRVPVLTGGGHGEGLWQLDLLPGPSAPRVRYVALDHRAPRDPAVRRVLDQLFARISSAQPEDEDDAVETARKATGGSYAGSQACASCHTSAYFAWRSTPHGRAYETLKARGRNLDFECVGCHVTGFGEPGGASLASLQHLQGVGCESCHGAGGAHVSNPQSRAARLPRVVPERVCVGCHDGEHSDRFDYASALLKVVIPGHGRAMGAP